MKKISCAIPYYNNSRYIVETLHWIIKDDRINEIIICDDDSNDFDILLNILKKIRSPKCRIYKNDKNLGVYLNKLKSVNLCNNHWVILLDSDNVIQKSYIDSLEKEYPWSKNVIYTPVWAKTFPGLPSPKLNWTKYENNLIDTSNILELLSDRGVHCLMNNCNYFINKDEYMKCVTLNSNNYDQKLISCVDSMTLFTDWILCGNKVKVVKDMIYYHRLHSDSNYNKADKTKKDLWKETLFSDILIHNKMLLNNKIGISVIIPLFNGIEYLEECLNSVKEQTIKEWEIIVGINGHKLDSEIYKKAKMYESDKIRVVYYDVKGRVNALNAMVKDSKYNIICTLDVDDKLHKLKFEKQIPLIEKYDVISSNCSGLAGELYPS